ncbi:hypothetical protein AYO20_05125 [Fonsecaea nubica]|uniref:Uncharacterized protein n=1 Tax=Fonsecaea nubica TaxID=856822 RepID=A0A178D1A3_9EURO|nr:hypothetical protein AYO20_05125 [Fonsecaea nubica]OAL35506.1 hypothetical protein AYO20_05125 [Fonsecaea nubica]
MTGSGLYDQRCLKGVHTQRPNLSSIIFSYLVSETMARCFKPEDHPTKTKHHPLVDHMLSTDTQSAPMLVVERRQVLSASTTHQSDQQQPLPDMAPVVRAKLVQYGTTTGGANVGVGGRQVFKKKVEFGVTEVPHDSRNNPRNEEHTRAQQQSEDGSHEHDDDGPEVTDINGEPGEDELDEASLVYIQRGTISGGATVTVDQDQVFEDEVKFG